MSPVEFHPDARRELVESVRYYESQRRGLGRRFSLRIREAIQRIREYPRLHPVLEDDLHRCRVLHFPYGIVYRFTERGIQIIAVMHLHRRPGYWRSRGA